MDLSGQLLLQELGFLKQQGDVLMRAGAVMTEQANLIGHYIGGRPGFDKF